MNSICIVFLLAFLVQIRISKTHLIRQSVVGETVETEIVERRKTADSDLLASLLSSGNKKNFTLSKNGFIAGNLLCQCGMPTHRILSNNSVNDIPWTATFIRNGTEKFCAGVLVNDLYIVTAAHCVSNLNPSEISVVLSESRFLPTDKTLFTLPKYSVSQINIHPDYNEVATPKQHDIALVKLSNPIDFFDTLLSPICLPANDEGYRKHIAIIPRWKPMGDTDKNDIPLAHKALNGTCVNSCSQSAQIKVRLRVLDNQQCKTETEYKGRISEDMLCAELVTKQQSLCKGNSDGPMTIKEKDRHYLVGIASLGDGCSIVYSSSIYTRVASYIGFILGNTTDAGWCIE